MAERLKALVLKTSNGATHSWVRIPPPPPKYYRLNLFSFSDLELTDLDRIIKLDDEILNKWYHEKNQINLVPNNKVSKLLKNFKL